jgi:bisphosphoglycerate-dependent phosphoglycerate mutase
MMAKICPKRSYTTEKVDIDFKKEMKELAKFRYFNKLANKEPSIPEMTRLVRRSPYWQNVVYNLRTKQKKEDL